MSRPLVVQPFDPQLLAVQITPTPLSGVQLQSAYIDSILLTVYSTAANSVFLGNGAVTVTTGIEIPAGVTIQLTISNERPLIELETPLLDLARKILCLNPKRTEVPFVYWDVTQLFVIAAAPTNMIVTAVKRAWVG